MNRICNLCNEPRTKKSYLGYSEIYCNYCKNDGCYDCIEKCVLCEKYVCYYCNSDICPCCK
jgi:hypothetical protein